MVSASDLAKRALVSVLRNLFSLYSVAISISRDSPDSEVRTAYRTLSRKTHPDHGGRFREPGAAGPVTKTGGSRQTDGGRGSDETNKKDRGADTRGEKKQKEASQEGRATEQGPTQMKKHQNKAKRRPTKSDGEEGDARKAQRTQKKTTKA